MDWLLRAATALVRFLQTNSWLGGYLGHVYVAKVETTQVTQYFRYHPNGKNGRVYVDGKLKLDNWIPLYAGKPTLVRAYFSRFGSFTDTVTAELRLPDGKIIPVLGPIFGLDFMWNFTVPSRVWPDARAGNLNFLLPPEVCTGTVDAEIAFWRMNSTDREVATQPVKLQFRPAAKLVARVVYVAIKQGGSQPFQATINQTVSTLAACVPAFPIAGFDFTPCARLEFDEPWQGHSVTTYDWWSEVVTRVSQVQRLSTPVDLHVGLLPMTPSWPPSLNGADAAGIATSSDVGNDPRYFRSAVTFAECPRLMAHEIFHAMHDTDDELGHAPAPATCPVQKDVDPNYPSYDPYDVGSIGEFGFDLQRLIQFRPHSDYMPHSNAHDLMTSCHAGVSPAQRDLTEEWISPYNYLRLSDAIYQPADMTLEPWMPRVKSLVIDLTRKPDQSMTVVGLLSAAGACAAPPVAGGQLEVRVVDDRGEVLATGSANASVRCREATPDRRVWFGAVTWPEGSASVEVWSSNTRVAAFAPEIDVLESKIETDFAAGRQSLVRVSWEAPGAERALIRFSNDAGHTWSVVESGPAKGSQVFHFDQLPGGDECMFEVLAGVGLKTGSARSSSFAVERTPRLATIVPPTEDTFVSLQGGCWSPDFGLADPKETVWRTGDGREFGRGYLVFLIGLEVGRERVSVEAPDGLGGTARSELDLRVEEREPGSKVGVLERLH
jgi:hypothetical protein